MRTRLNVVFVIGIAAFAVTVIGAAIPEVPDIAIEMSSAIAFVAVLAYVLFPGE